MLINVISNLNKFLFVQALGYTDNAVSKAHINNFIQLTNGITFNH
ncbi:hypothetical protein EVA_06844 [gut metagenome]|uniref:Uncharacterized protein n=1 Tax=gut metagenome TaxID=749906 RepID=J9GCK7_9ZZZZ